MSGAIADSARADGARGDDVTVDGAIVEAARGGGAEVAGPIDARRRAGRNTHAAAAGRAIGGTGGS